MNETWNSRATAPSTVTAGIVLAVAAVACWIVLAVTRSQAGMTGTIFVCRDVAIVHVLTVLPIAVLLAMRLQAGRPVMVRVMPAVLSLVVSVLLIAGNPSGGGSSFSGAVLPSLARTAAAFGVALAAVLLTASLSRQDRRPTAAGRKFALACGFGLAVAVLLPAIYVQARCRHQAQTLNELLAQSRLGEAQVQIRELISLAPALEWQGRPLRRVALEIDRQVGELESKISRPLPDQATVEDLLDRCRQLAILGHTGEALETLRPLLDSSVRLAACDLSGSICEAADRWEPARTFHQRAKEGWLRQPESPARRAGLFQATTRLGYCQRKLGNYEQAEAEYSEALALSPTAETHFLVARFYEDMQQSARARWHARRAMMLAPERYQRDGMRLIDNLMVGHFGCLNVYSAERPSGPPGPANPLSPGRAR